MSKFKIAGIRVRLSTVFGVAFLLAGLVAFVTAALAQMAPSITAVPLGYCQLTSITSATALSSCAGGIPAGANMILMQAEAQNARWRDDGTAPTTTIGMLLSTGAAFPTSYTGTLSKLQFINATAGTIVDVSFYRTSSP